VILDMNALSAFAEGSTRIAAALQGRVQPAVPVVVLGEYLHGIAHSTRRRIYETWLDRYLTTFRVLEITMETAAECAAIRSELKQLGKPIPANDVWIAALCRQHELPLLSRDGHFDRVRHLLRKEW
jgi:tRNA(fMet)-specific endonuclease VapC